MSNLKKVATALTVAMLLVVVVLVFRFECEVQARWDEYIAHCDSQTATTQEVLEETNPTPNKVIVGVGEDGNVIKVFDDYIEIWFCDELTDTLEWDSDDLYLNSNGELFELTDCSGVQYDSEGHSKFEVVSYYNPNMRVLYGVEDNAPEETDSVLLLLNDEENCTDDEVFFYGTTQ